MNRIILTVGIAAFIAGCASSGRVGELPVIAAGQAAGKLVLIRSSNLIGAANAYYVALDGKDVFAIRSGENTELKVAEGEHYVAVKCFGGFTPTWKEESIKFTASPAKANFFEISPSTSCAKIAAVSEDDGKKAVASTKFISPDTQAAAK
jgi:hypothetical protein